MFALALLSVLPGIADAPIVNAVADARLNDVCFVDVRKGWAVGDRGAVWHTDDGGKTWTFEDPENFSGDGVEPKPSPGRINFAHPDFAQRYLRTLLVTDGRLQRFLGQ